MRGSWLSWALVVAPMMFSTFGPAQGQQLGEPAPDFRLEESRGGEVALSDFANKVVFINFFGFN
jgi:hypothetical protein